MRAVKLKICVIGLGYVGLPLAVALSKKYEVIGFDTNFDRVSALISGVDKTKEVPADVLSNSQVRFTTNIQDIISCNMFIVAVPTPIDNAKKPDLNSLISASSAVGRCLKLNDVVVYESTVYPGATREVCAPILERVSGLKVDVDFHLGYSPERINPGDEVHRFEKITKVVSGGTPRAVEIINDVYSSVVDAGTFIASSIEVAEAAKVIENTQRDVNVAFMNECSKIFAQLGIDTSEVLEAASTKWNFLNFKPGLVGGHCIGVDPYYLLHKASEINVHAAMIEVSRRTNDEYVTWLSSIFIKRFMAVRNQHTTSKVIVLGVTFKENCPDTRNSKVFDLILELESYGILISIHDPLVHPNDLDVNLRGKYVNKFDDSYDAVILAVPHEQYLGNSWIDWRDLHEKNILIFDIKSALPNTNNILRV
jgi:UDP-N-acetyl-D-galactosamine dehydrogenase